MTYKAGMSGPDVIKIQQALIDKGYKIASPTGYFGEQTDSAVRAFQASKGLSVDGQVGTRTWSALFSGFTFSIPYVEVAPASAPPLLPPPSAPTGTPTGTPKRPAPGASYPAPSYRGPVAASSGGFMSFLEANWIWLAGALLLVPFLLPKKGR